VVQDNLNAHTAGTLYKAFVPQQARCILAKLEFHYTLKHGSRHNQAKIDQHLRAQLPNSRLVADTATLEHRIWASEAVRN
jgi:hypothetical protein